MRKSLSRRRFLSSTAVVASSLAWTKASSQAISATVLDVRSFGAGAGNATSAIQAALNAAGRMAAGRVVATDRQYLADELVVPPGVQFEFDLKMRTAASPGVERNGLRPHAGCRLIGKIEGNYVTAREVVERGIFPAVEGCHDVYLDVEVRGTTVGVQAHLSDLNNPPRRWRGRIVARDIAAYLGGSNGYGLNGALRDSDLVLYTTNVPRHGLYLAAGASNNRIELHDEGGRFSPVDIAAFEGQPECVGNTIEAYVRNHRGDYPGLPCVGGLFAGGCRNNTLELHVSDSRPLYSAFRFLAMSRSSYPRDNSVSVYFDGEITGYGVVECNSGSGNRVSVYGRGSSTRTPSAVVYVGRNDAITPSRPGRYAAIIEAMDFTCVSGFEHVVISAENYAITDVGSAAIKARGYSKEAVNAYTFGQFVSGRIGS
jgi:hypothetical protein